ncbi:hypothetical protein HAX54_036352, partial [Datura stramonium]|nr:hypothetical protein [Datura stramonium]
RVTGFKKALLGPRLQEADRIDVLTRWDVNSGNAKSKTWTWFTHSSSKDHFLFGSFRNGYKEWVFPLVKGYWDRSLQPSLAWKVAREKKIILLSSFFNLPEVRILSPPNQWNTVHRDRRPVPTRLQLEGSGVNGRYYWKDSSLDNR